MDSFSSEIVNTVTLSHKHDLQLLSIREVVDVFCELPVNLIVFHRNINCNTSLQVNNILFESSNLVMRTFKFKLAVLKCC
jgi:hypothetical protein